MKSSKSGKSKRSATAAVAVQPAPSTRYWPYGVAVVAALLVVLEVYWPAVNGPFLLDDSYLPYMLPGYVDAPLLAWLKGMRPVLMFSYWLNYHNAGNQSTFGYHLVNIVLHFSNGICVFLATHRVLSWTSLDKWRSTVLAIFAAGLFLLHPLQTESVSYVASRSETLSLFWVLLAFIVFLYADRRTMLTRRAFAILGLFGAAVLTKEHTAVLPALFLLTDYYWNPGFSLDGIRRNWRLYVPMVMAGAVGLAFVWRVLKGAGTAGFGMKDFTWYQYFFTQCRAVWGYLRLFLLPVGQNLDVDFTISRTLIEHGAVIGLIALLVVTALAWIYRRRFPLASYGWFTFLILIAPTSSFVPIRDPFAERRLYLPFIGLLFITLEFLRRWKPGRGTMIAALGAVLIAEGAGTYHRNQLWGSAIDIWKDTVEKSPRKLRPRFQLAFNYYLAGSCENAAAQYAEAAKLEKPTFDLLLDWGLAYDCLGNSGQALAKFRQAATIEQSAHVYSQIGMEYGKSRQYAEALDALETAVRLDPNFAMSYYTRGNVYEAQGNKAQAAAEYRHALSIDSKLQLARDALARIGQ